MYKIYSHNIFLFHVIQLTFYAYVQQECLQKQTLADWQLTLCIFLNAIRNQ